MAWRAARPTAGHDDLAGGACGGDLSCQSGRPARICRTRPRSVPTPGPGAPDGLPAELHGILATILGLASTNDGGACGCTSGGVLRREALREQLFPLRRPKVAIRSANARRPGRSRQGADLLLQGLCVIYSGAFGPGNGQSSNRSPDQVHNWPSPPDFPSIWTLRLAQHEALDNQGLWLCYPVFRSRSVGKSEPSRTVSEAPDVSASVKKRLAPARGVILAVGIGLLVWALIIACLAFF